MWRDDIDFERELGNYWEEECDYDARRLSSKSSVKRIFDLRAKAAKTFKRIHDGVSHSSRRPKMV